MFVIMKLDFLEAYSAVHLDGRETECRNAGTPERAKANSQQKEGIGHPGGEKENNVQTRPKKRENVRRRCEKKRV